MSACQIVRFRATCSLKALEMRPGLIDLLDGYEKVVELPNVRPIHGDQPAC